MTSINATISKSCARIERRPKTNAGGAVAMAGKMVTVKPQM
jgi:hypothetical protein